MRKLKNLRRYCEEKIDREKVVQKANVECAQLDSVHSDEQSAAAAVKILGQAYPTVP